MEVLKVGLKTALKEGAEVMLPPSKSLSNRALLLASLGRGRCLVRNVLKSDDTARMIGALQALGVSLEVKDAGDVLIEGTGSLFESGKPLTLDLGNAGTAMRPLCAALALSSGTFTLTGVERMMQRPIGHLVEALRAMGCKIEYLKNEGFPPLKIEGTAVENAQTVIDGSASSQFISALLMTGPCLKGGLKLKVAGTLISKPYVDLTISLMEQFGAKVKREGYEFFEVLGTGYSNPPEALIEGDASSASYFMAMGAIAGPIVIYGAGSKSEQGDLKFADVLSQMGADIKVNEDCIIVNKSNLHGIDIDMNDMPDAAMTLIPLCLYADGPVAVRNVGSWRVKETDRIAALAKEMRKVGVKVEEGPDYLVVDGSVRNREIPQFATYDDHRMAMCLSLVAFDRPVLIEDPDCTKKTFPGYFEVFDRLCLGAD